MDLIGIPKIAFDNRLGHSSVTRMLGRLVLGRSVASLYQDKNIMKLLISK